MNITEIILDFQRFILSNWPKLRDHMEMLDWDESPYFLEEWLQENWEILVEKKVVKSGDFLRPIGYEGKPSCRIKHPNSQATYQIEACSKLDKKCYIFLNFVSVSKKKISFEPPLDHIDLKDKNTKNIINGKISDYYFILNKL